jgi:hypothetical protein
MHTLHLDLTQRGPPSSGGLGGGGGGMWWRGGRGGGNVDFIPLNAHTVAFYVSNGMTYLTTNALQLRVAERTEEKARRGKRDACTEAASAAAGRVLRVRDAAAAGRALGVRDASRKRAAPGPQAGPHRSFSGFCNKNYMRAQSTSPAGKLLV